MTSVRRKWSDHQANQRSKSTRTKNPLAADVLRGCRLDREVIQESLFCEYTPIERF